MSARPRFPAPSPDLGRCSSPGRPSALLPLVVVYVLLRLLAAVSPPDPTWIAGLYDDGDLDDVVTLVGSFVAVSSAPEAGLAVPDRRVTSLPLSPAPVPRSSIPLSLPARSPPPA